MDVVIEVELAGGIGILIRRVSGLLLDFEITLSGPIRCLFACPAFGEL